MPGHHSIRIPIHGFVELDDWEWDIINHAVFQRLRRIRQLALSEHVYPGATHTRFEHSLGVLHIADSLFSTLKAKHEPLLRSAEYGFDDESFARSRRLVRLAALLHDVGHAPFSHTGEDVMPDGSDGQRLDHERYSAELVAEEMKDVIDDHEVNQAGLRITGREVADFYLGRSHIGRKLLLWRELISGQLDADRMDYLLRDAHHCGVSYGTFDLDRIVDTICFVEDKSLESPADLRIGIEEGGTHAAEGLILARYFMFTQVYSHRTRLAFDYHAAEALKLFLRGDTLPTPFTPTGREKYLAMDDWTVGHFIHRGKADRHGDAILGHRHDRCISETSEVASLDELRHHDELLKRLRDIGIDAWEADVSRSWYKPGPSEVQIGQPQSGESVRKAIPLAQVSEIAGRIRDSKMKLIFVPHDAREQANAIKEEAR